MRDKIVSYYIDQVIMCKNSIKENSVAVIVEAKTDEKFFQKFFDINTTFFAVDGFKNVIEVVEKFENEIPYILGIIDADFRHCTNEKIASNNIFITDYHDVEMMLIKSKAWDEVIGLHSQKTKLLKFQKQFSKSLLDNILELSRSVANFRFLEYKNKLGLTFKTFSNGKYKFIDYSNFIDKEQFCINSKNLIETIENKSQKQGFFKNNPAFVKELTKISTQNFELLNFCNGHDVINILSYALKKEIGNEDISGEELVLFFIVAYRIDDFIETKLFQNLKKWETENSEFVLLKSQNPK